MGEETERKGRMTTGAEREAARQLWERSFNLLFQADGAHVRVRFKFNFIQIIMTTNTQLLRATHGGKKVFYTDTQ